MSGGIVHPAGCRCPGCLPGQYVMRPASPPRPRPARTPSRTQPASGGSTATVWAVIIGIIAGWFFITWPAYAWHGQNNAGGWRWDIHTTVALSIWWGILLAGLCAAVVSDNRGKARQAAARAAASAPKAPVCTHRNAVPVESALDPAVTLARWCPDCETQLEVKP